MDVNIQRTDRLVLCDNKMLWQLTKATFRCAQEDTSKAESSVNMKIFIGLKDLHAELLGLTTLDFFPFGYLDDKVWNIPYPIIRMQSTNMVKVRTAVTSMQTYYKTYDPNSFYFVKDGCRNVYLSMGIILKMNKMKMKIIFK